MTAITISDPPAAIYARISRDAEGERLGVDRQVADCRKLANELGYEVTAVYVDNDTSASTASRKPRPAYAEMMNAARSGQFRAVLAYSNSRLTRRVREYLDLVDLTHKGGVLIKTVVSGQHDLSTADGVGAALTVAVWDQAEAQRTAERVKRKKAESAAAGRYRGGMRPYGFDSDGVTIREEEAAVIRHATKAVLAGRTLAGVARELNERGAVTSRGKPWTYDRLRDVLVRPRNAGLLSSGRSERPEEMQVVGKAVWEPIVSEDEWRALWTLLTDPTRRRQEGNAPRWLGSGLYRCGKCGGPMRAAPHGGTPSQGGRGRKYHYRCTNEAHLTVAAALTDEYVLGVVAEMVRDPRVVTAMHPGDSHLTADRERRTTLAARLTSFETDYALGRITGAQLQKATATVTAEIADVDDRLAKATRRSSMAGVIRSADPGAAFLAAPVDVQRAVLAAVLDVEVLPAAVRGAAWSPDRLRFSPIAADADA